MRGYMQNFACFTLFNWKDRVLESKLFLSVGGVSLKNKLTAKVRKLLKHVI